MSESVTRKKQKHTHGLADKELCLEFTNTIAVHDGTATDDRLVGYAELVRWAVEEGVLTGSESGRLLEEAERRPADAAMTLWQAIELRTAIYRLFSALARGATPADGDLATLNAALSRAMPRACLVPGASSVGWNWMADSAELDRMLWPVAASAAELLTSADVNRVVECAGNTCAWLFLDTTKNRSRRYCSADGCGNRARARRHYARKRAAPRIKSNGIDR